MQPFNGIRVVDATHVIAGPYGTYLLATLGADVIKIESPSEPDQTRTQGQDRGLADQQMGTWYLSQAANKRSVTVDLKQPEGLEVFKRMLVDADILVENYRPGAFANLGLDDDTIGKINPRLIHCSVSAFGQRGPRATETGYDMVIQAASGLMAMTGTEAVNPIKVGAPVIDYATGMSAAFAISAALLQRERTGRGQRIDLAMFDVALSMMGLFVTEHSCSGADPKPRGHRGPYPTTGCYETREGLLMIGASNERQQERLWRALGRPEMFKRGNSATVSDRELEFRLLTETFLKRTAAQWERYLQDNHVPASQVRTMTEAIRDPQLRDRAVFTEFDSVSGGARTYRVPVAPFMYAHDGPQVTRPPAPLGTHTAEIVSELGYSAAEVQALKAKKAI